MPDSNVPDFGAPAVRPPGQSIKTVTPGHLRQKDADSDA